MTGSKPTLDKLPSVPADRGMRWIAAPLVSVVAGCAVPKHRP